MNYEDDICNISSYNYMKASTRQQPGYMLILVMSCLGMLVTGPSRNNIDLQLMMIQTLHSSGS